MSPDEYIEKLEAERDELKAQLDLLWEHFRRAALAAATERLNTSLAEAEKVLREFRFATTAEVPIPNLDGRKLAFGKYEQQWCLLVIEERSSEDFVSPLRMAPREWRVKAVRALPLLLDALMVATEQHAAEADLAARQADKFVEATRRIVPDGT